MRGTALIKVLKLDLISFLISARTLSQISVFIDSITVSLALLTDTIALAKRALDSMFLQAVHIHTRCALALAETYISSVKPEHRLHTIDEQKAPHLTESPEMGFAHFSQTVVISLKLATL